MDLYLLKFNNYYNRIVKLFDNLEGYMPYVLQPGIASVQEKNPIINVNFVPGDGVNTEQIINWSGETPDYIVATDPRTGAINSRWFIINTSRTRGGQYHLTLHRDVMADYYYDLLDAPTFIEKATLTGDNPLIFNAEDMTFNQIKTEETLLKDASGCPWVVIYAAQKDGEGRIITYEDTITTEIPVDLEIAYDEWINFFLNSRDAAGAVVLNSLNFLGREQRPGTNYKQPVHWRIRENTATKENINYGSEDILIKNDLNENSFAYFQNDWEAIENSIGSYIEKYSPEAFKRWLGLNNQIIKILPAKAGDPALYYRVTAWPKVRMGMLGYVQGAGNFQNLLLKNIRLSQIYLSTYGYKDEDIYALYGYSKLYITLDSLNGTTQLGSFNIGTNRQHNQDAPYDLFCMPYSESLVISNNKVSGFTSITANKGIAFQFARTMTTKYAGAGTVYDAQILPYCPIISGEVSNNNFDIQTTEAGYTPIVKDNVTVGYILHASVSSFSRNIPLDQPIRITEPKIQSQCDMYRLCSPNYNGIFEFNAAKNGGIQWFNVVCTYKPFSPYIKVYPNFGGLYGSDYNDQRGLICGGDFSLPVVTDAWKTYELQNKNYQNTFDRQIQNMEIQNNIARIQERWQMAAGVGSAALSGGNSGLAIGMAAGPVGGAIGAALGGTLGAGLSIAGGLMDLKYNEQLRQEAMSYAKDQFGYSLGNIRALPQSLSKTSAYNADNKYFPFLEYYTCTEEEKQALRDKIKYNGMTVMVIGTIRKYLQLDYSYIKGRLIRAEAIKADYNITNAIATEMFQGVFIK